MIANLQMKEIVEFEDKKKTCTDLYGGVGIRNVVSLSERIICGKRERCS